MPVLRTQPFHVKHRAARSRRGEYVALSGIIALWSSAFAPEIATGGVLRRAAARAGDASGASGEHREAEGVSASEWSLLQTVPITANGTNFDSPNARQFSRRVRD